MRRIKFLGVCALFVMLVVQAQAQELKSIYYQGVLLDPAGEVMPDGVYAISFAFYDAPAGGKQLWVEQQKLYVQNGEFVVQLGEVNPLNISFDKSTWLAVTLEGDETLAERTEFALPGASLDPK